MAAPIAPPDAQAEVSVDSLAFPLASSDRSRTFELTGAELERVHELGTTQGFKAAAGLACGLGVVALLTLVYRKQ